MRTAFLVKIQERRAFQAKRLRKATAWRWENKIFLLYFPFSYPNLTKHLGTTSSHLPHEAFPDTSALADLSLFLEHSCLNCSSDLHRLAEEYNGYGHSFCEALGTLLTFSSPRFLRL